MAKIGDGVAVLLTAAVDVRGASNTANSDPKVRLAEYVHAFERWCRCPAARKVVLCENTGFDLTPFLDIWEKLVKDSDREFEAIGFDTRGTIPPERAKGLGEMAILGHAMRRSSLIRGVNRVVKITGRYVVRNPEDLIEQSAREDAPELICSFRGKLSWADSRMFMCKPSFVEQYLEQYVDLVDGQFVWFEHAFARAVHRALADGWLWEPPRAWIDFEGLTGTHGNAIRSPLLRRTASRFFHRLKCLAYDR